MNQRGSRTVARVSQESFLAKLLFEGSAERHRLWVDLDFSACQVTFSSQTSSISASERKNLDIHFCDSVFFDVLFFQHLVEEFLKGMFL
jgi:hypothetical protein